MDEGPVILDETARAVLRVAGKRDGWIEQRLSYLAGELARLKAGVPL